MMSPKRSLSPSEQDQPEPKRARLENGEPKTIEILEEEDGSRAVKSQVPNQHFQARSGIQRSIAMVLKHDGFEAASPEAMESFTEMVETCQCRILRFLPCSIANCPYRHQLLN